MTDISTSTETVTKIEPNLSVKEPPLFKVIYINDNKTSMQFVMESLISSFSYDQVPAEKITNDINSQGSAIVAVLPYEIAEQKGIEVTIKARSNGFPLQIKLEADE
jgi:ATP-dependent Clp protease adaptor protein ClpS